MSEHWSWCAGFVSDATQDGVWTNIKNTIEPLTKNTVHALSDGHGLGTDPSFAFTVVSSVKDNWVVFWNDCWRFCVWVFTTQRLSGILARAFINGSLSASLDYSFCFFEKGVLTDWFLSDPVKEFRNWGPTAVGDVLIPYFECKLPEEDFVRIDFSDMLDPVKNHVDLFGSRRIIDYRKSEVNVEEAESLLRISTVGQLFDCAKLVALPFFGPEYNIFSLAGFFQRQRNEPSGWYYSLNTLKPGADSEDQRPQEWLEAVASFAPMWFKHDKRREFWHTFGGRLLHTDY